jgi:hypothetical protein
MKKEKNIKSIKNIKKIILEEYKKFNLVEGEKYRERELSSWRNIGDEIGTSHVGASKIGDRAMVKIAMVFLANQVQDLMDKLDAKEISDNEYSIMLKALTPIKEKSKDLVKKPEFVEYFKSAYFGQG